MTNTIGGTPPTMNKIKPLYPKNCTTDNYISMGLSSVVFLESDTEVVKVAASFEDRPDIESEKRVYERLNFDGRHSGLVEYRGSKSYDEGKAWALHLGRAPNGSISQYIRKSATLPSLDLRMKWARQTADVLRYVHSKNVIHGDLSCNNIFLDENLNIRLGDFASSSIDGSRSEFSYSSCHTAPNPSSPEAADIFTLGSSLYHIMTGSLPFEDVADEFRLPEDYFQEGLFPDLTSLDAFEDVIEGCWKERYGSVEEVIIGLDS